MKGCLAATEMLVPAEIHLKPLEVHLAAAEMLMTVSSNAAVNIFFSEPRIFFLMMIADSPRLGQSASEQNFSDDSGCHPLAD